MASGPQHRDQPTQSQPPNDPMGFGGEERQAGYGKYHPGNKDNQEWGGVPGAFGDSMDPSESARDTAKGDEVSDEMGMVRPSEEPGIRQAIQGEHSKKAA